MPVLRDKLLNVLGDLLTGAGVTVIAGASAPAVIVAASAACATGLLSQALIQSKGEKAAQLEGEAKFQSMFSELKSLRKVLLQISSEQDAGQIFAAEKAEQLLAAIEAHAKGSSETNARAETVLRDIERSLEHWCTANASNLDRLFTELQSEVITARQETAAFRSEQRTAADENIRQHSKTHDSLQQVLEHVRSHNSPSRGLDAFSEIEKAVALLKEGNAAVAIYVLEAMRNKYWSELTAREKYRVLANLGVAYLQRDGDFHRTAKLFLEAAQADPSHENALCLQSSAYLDLNEPLKALELAKEAVAKSPLSVPAHAAHIRALPNDIKFRDVEDSVPKHIREEYEIAVALGMRALTDSFHEQRPLRMEELAAAERYLSLPHVLAQKHPVVVAQLGMVIIESERQKSLEHDFEPVINDKSRFVAAITHLENALDGKNGFLPPEWRGRALHAMGVANALLGDKTKAERNFEDAYGYIPTDTSVVLHRSVILHQRSETTAAIDLLAKHHVDGPLKPHDLMLCRLLIRRHQGDDLKTAESLLRMGVTRLAETETTLRTQIVDLLVGFLKSENRHSAAEEILNSISADCLDPAIVQTLKADISRGKGQLINAQQLIESAVGLIRPDTTNEVRFMVSVAAQDCGRNDLAFPLLKELLPPDRILPETPRLFLAAQSVGDDEFILDYCESLRKNGIIDWRAIGLEANTLLQYNDPGTAVELLQGFVASNPGDDQAKLARVQLGEIGIRCEREELIETDLAKLPELEIAGANWGEATVRVIRATDPTAAIHYAYRLVRKYFDKPAAHRALIASLVPQRDKPVFLPSYTVVSPDSAVRFREKGSANDEWWLIETDTSTPIDVGRRELNITHALAFEMMNKGVGETFFIDKNGLQDRVGEILEIIDKRVYRLRDSAFHFRERFPDEPFFILAMNLAKADGSFDSEPIVRSVQQRAKQVEEIEKLVTTHRLPITTMAMWLKAEVADTVAYLGRNNGPRQICCEGDLLEFENATKQASAAEVVILDASALSVLMLSGAYTGIRKGHVQMLTSEGTFAEFRQLYRDARTSGSESSIGSFTKRGDHIAIVESTLEERANREMLLSAFTSWASDNLQIVNGLALARIKPAEREALISACGRPAAETIAIAQSKNCIMWTDDASLVQLVKQQFPVRTVWSQVMVDIFQGHGQIDVKCVDLLACWLIKNRFHFVRVSHASLLRAATLSGWNGSKEPLRTILRVFCEQHSEGVGLMHFAIRSLYDLSQRAPDVQAAYSAISSLLDYWALHPRGLEHIVFVKTKATTLYWPDMSTALLIKGHLSRWLMSYTFLDPPLR